jgi:hypothetical protein
MASSIHSYAQANDLTFGKHGALRCCNGSSSLGSQGQVFLDVVAWEIVHAIEN